MRESLDNTYAVSEAEDLNPTQMVMVVLNMMIVTHFEYSKKNRFLHNLEQTASVLNGYLEMLMDSGRFTDMREEEDV